MAPFGRTTCTVHSISACTIKVSKSRKQILKFSFEPENERKPFFISALASKKKSNQKNKDTVYH